MDEFVITHGKKLKLGYTTGSCAVAAAKAAALMLYNKKEISRILLDTPAGKRLELIPENITITDDYAECSIKKDSGDDPDVTNGIDIFAKVEKTTDNTSITIKGGTGIGRVTKKGLPLEPGTHAINPVPRKMIEHEVGKIKDSHTGLIVTISAPQGLELAKRTFNAKLGIEGGISIIGTTGIIKPMSNQAIKDSLSLELSIKAAAGKKSIVYVPGNYGKNYAQRTYKLTHDKILMTSNYIGYMLEQAVYYKIKNIVLIGHIGKLVKVAGGNFNTHNKESDARFEILTAHYILLGGDVAQAKKIMTCTTTEEALEYIDVAHFYEHLADRIKKKCIAYCNNCINVEVVVFSMEKGHLASTQNAITLLNEIRGGHV